MNIGTSHRIYYNTMSTDGIYLVLTEASINIPNISKTYMTCREELTCAEHSALLLSYRGLNKDNTFGYSIGQLILLVYSFQLESRISLEKNQLIHISPGPQKL